MKYIPVYCSICNTSFDLLEDDYGYMGTCDCTDVPTDPELEDTIFLSLDGLEACKRAWHDMVFVCALDEGDNSQYTQRINETKEILAKIIAKLEIT